MPVHAAESPRDAEPDEALEAPPIPAEAEPKPGEEGWVPPAGTKYLDVFDQTFMLQPEIPGVLIMEMGALAANDVDESEAAALIADFMRTVPQPHERKRFRKFLMEPRPDGSVIGMEIYIEIYQAACEAYSDFPTEPPSGSQDG